MMRRMKNFFGTLASLFNVEKEDCPLCKQASVIQLKQLGLCKSCFDRIPWILKVQCPICGRGEKCWDCQRRQLTYFTKNRSAVKYDNSMKGLLARYKYRGDERLESVIGNMLVHAYHLVKIDEQKEASNSSRAQSIITFVPVSDRRMLERGFNQAEQMAFELGRRVGLIVVPLLTRSKHTDKQSFKKRNERLEDLEHVFELDLSYITHEGLVETSGIIYLVDDVYTTGSTMNQCASVLRDNFSAEVVGLTWAR
ncbi:ComF family protein [Paenibacillus sp. HWE-109]|uniref:ComF family protein n=1 Tax=Paenibacillus sp. HWE-109 TaxID=1306526 RepID=UPI001EE1349E|nr:ComF family protein [Paenibacillus sp. HWE-109]UKS26128.1 ComF family protein [Paenibacillus sp. HWE-109]